MPSLVKIKVERGRDLPSSDNSNASTETSTDAYVEIKLDDQVQRTSTCRKSNNPVWNEEFRFEVTDDSVLQDAPVELKCMDHDIYSTEFIGVVYIDLNPLIMRTAHGSHRNMVISGWFPLFDTAKGVRGALLVTVKLQFIGNENPFGDSSAGVQFFSSSQLSPKCFVIQEIIGFVEDLVVEENPENTWQDYFRKANKALNESRLKVLYNLSAEVRRELGKKVLESGGNAVLAYSVQFDTEGASGIVARAYGTACKLLKVDEDVNTVVVPLQHFQAVVPQSASEWRGILDGTGCMALIQRDTAELLSLRLAREMNLSNTSSGGGSSTTNKSEALVWAQVDETRMVHFLQLLPFGASRDSKLPGTRDHAGSGAVFPLTGKADFGGLDWGAAGVTVDNSNIFQSEVQLLSMRSFPENVRIKLGGLVMARSVKFLGKLEASVSDQETRDGWWAELRDEIKSHAKVLCCKHIIGYSETSTIFGDVCILTAVGTAAALKHLAHPTSYLTHQVVPGTLPLSVSDSTTSTALAASANSLLGGGVQKGTTTTTTPRAPRQARTTSDGIAIQAERSSSADSVDLECLNPLVVAPGAVALHMPRATSNSHLPGQQDSAHSSSTSGVTTPSSTLQRSTLSQEGRGSSGRKGWSAQEDSEQTTPQSTRGTSLVPLSAGSWKKGRRPCVAVHVPYNHRTAPFSFMRLVPCATCRRKWVPETLLSSTDPPSSLQVKGCGQILEARVCRYRKAGTGEGDAVKISEVLPFVEYDLQRQLILKLKVLGMNAAFGYTCQIQVGSDLVIATATCTAVWLESLPTPPPVQIVRARDGRSQQELRLAMLQRQLEDLMAFNKDSLDKQHAHNRMVVRRRQLLARGGSGRPGTARESQRRTSVNSASSGRSGTGLDAQRNSIGEELHSGGHATEDSLEGSMDSYSASSSGSGSSSSSTSSSSSSSEDDTSDGDDSSSLESPPSSSSSSSTERDDEDEKESDGEEGEDAAEAEVVTDTTDLMPADIAGPVAMINFDAKGKTVGADEAGEVVNRSRKPSSASSSTDRDKKAAEARKAKRKRRMVYKDDRVPFLMEVDDETDSDIVAVLSDWCAPVGFDMVNTAFVPGSVEFPFSSGRQVCVMRRGRVMMPKSNTGGYQYAGTAPSSAALNGMLSRLFLEAYLRLCYTVKDLQPCQVLGTTHSVNIAEDGMVEIIVNAMVHRAAKIQRNRFLPTIREGSSLQEGTGRKAPSLTASRSDNALERSPGSSPVGGTRPRNETQYSVTSTLTASSAVVPVPVVNSSALYDRSDRRRSESTDSNSTLPGELLLYGNQSYISEPDASGKYSPLPSVHGTANSRPPVVSMSRQASSSTVNASRQTSTSNAGENRSPVIASRQTASTSNAGESARAAQQHKAQSSGGATGAPHLSAINQVILTPLPDIPGARVKKYLGPILLHFLKDSFTMRGPTGGGGSMGSFYYLMISEANAVARAHVAALGGNALICYKVVPQESGGRASRNQPYNLLSVTGDAVFLEFAPEASAFLSAGASTDLLGQVAGAANVGTTRFADQQPEVQEGDTGWSITR